jgi:diguanylate cyclase (GGDEF)-like protein
MSANRDSRKLHAALIPLLVPSNPAPYGFSPFGTRDCYYSASQGGPGRRLSVVEKKGLRVYARLSRLPFPRSYLGKMLLAAFLGTHVPLIALVLYLVLSPLAGGFEAKLGVFAVVLVATLLGTFATLYTLYVLLKPVSMASEALRGYLNDGKMPALPTGFTDRAGKLMADVQHAVEHLDEVIRSLEERSATDHLTGVYNRRAAEERLAQDLARAERSGSVLTVALMDVDQFKPVNDRHGHQAGDACLKHVASVLRRNARKGDWVARWGGDEFLLALWDAGGGRQARRTLERVAEEVAENPVELPGGRKLRLTLSGGACRSTGGGGTAEEMIARADQALYRAKEGGKNRFVHV